MYLLCKASIDCAHRIDDNHHLLTKKCARPHGHRYDFTIELEMNMLRHFYVRGFVDFALIKKDVIEDILGKYDHADITKKHGIHTVEEFAAVIKDKLTMLYGQPNEEHIIVTVFETEKWGVRA